MKNADLYSHQYSIPELEANIDHLSLKSVVDTQHLTSTFCKKYILSESVTSEYDDENDCLTMSYILSKQTHLTAAELT